MIVSRKLDGGTLNRSQHKSPVTPKRRKVTVGLLEEFTSAHARSSHGAYREYKL